MSYIDLYMKQSPLISGTGTGSPKATVFGVPFDATHSYRPGTRFGPDAIREAFNNIEIFHPRLRQDLEAVEIEDLGNTVQTASPEKLQEMLRRITGELLGRGRQIIILGGEHSITPGTYGCFPKDTGYVVFDAHYDLRDEYAGTRLSHAACLRRIAEERGADDIVHVGARAYAAEELEFLTKNRIRTVSDKDIRDGKGPGLLRDEISVFGNLYASFDLDVVDPAFAPGVGNPEAVGITPRELFEMMESLEGRKVSADIVELNPGYDNGSTAVLAAKILSTVIAMGL